MQYIDDAFVEGNEEPVDDEPVDDEEDQEAETVQLNGVAAARGRRLKPSGSNHEDARGTPGNAASQPYEPVRKLR